MRGAELLPGSHNIEPEEFDVRSWHKFRRAITRLRRKFHAITQNKVYREHDRETFNSPQSVIYELVFRGQTKDYIDSGSGESLLLPQAFRPGIRPTWVHRGPPGLWGEFPAFVFDRDLAPPSFEPLTKGDKAQIEAFHEGLRNYCFRVTGVLTAGA
jgi:hypothetical protein